MWHPENSSKIGLLNRCGYISDYWLALRDLQLLYWTQTADCTRWTTTASISDLGIGELPLCSDLPNFLARAQHQTGQQL